VIWIGGIGASVGDLPWERISQEQVKNTQDDSWLSCEVEGSIQGIPLVCGQLEGRYTGCFLSC